MNVWGPLRASPVVDGVARQVANGDVAHAWLLLAPAGSGKRTVALALAAALNCDVEPDVGCGGCSGCLRTMRRRHPDVHPIVPEGPLIPVDVIREAVLPEAARSPFEGRYKVFIIEEADKMNEAAQNALLKTLEEPAGPTVFVLTSDQEDELLETVRSRCRVVRLEPLAEPGVVDLLVHEGAAPDVAQLAARVAQGDLGRARALAFEEQAAERRRLWTRIPRRLVSPVGALDVAAEVLDETARSLKELERRQKTEVTELAEAMGEARGTAGARAALTMRHKRELRRLEQEVLGEAFQTLGSFYRDVLAMRRHSGDAVSNIDLTDELSVWAESQLPDAALVAAVARCLRAQASLALNANQTLAVESALVELARVAPPAARVGVQPA